VPVDLGLSAYANARALHDVRKKQQVCVVHSSHGSHGLMVDLLQGV